jgi:hypothetical protein
VSRTTDRINAIVAAAVSRGYKLTTYEDRVWAPGMYEIELSILHVNGMVFWKIKIDHLGRVSARESFNGFSTRTGKEIDLSHKVSLAEVERYFDIDRSKS